MPGRLWTLSIALACCGCLEPDDETAETSAPDQEGPVDDSALITCSGAGVSDEDAEYEQAVLDLVNQVRSEGASCGGRAMPRVSPLSFHPALMCAARAHAQDMANRDYFEHDSPDGTTPFERIQRAGYDFTAAAENIALGGSSPEGVMEQWMSSTGHCQNILGSQYEDFGVGFATGSAGNVLWTQTFGGQR